MKKEEIKSITIKRGNSKKETFDATKECYQCGKESDWILRVEDKYYCKYKNL